MSHAGFARYDDYKDSGVEWIDVAPSHWPKLRLKDIVAKLESGVSVNASDEPVEGDNIGVLKTSCVGKGTFLPNQNKSVWSTEIERVCVPVRAGRIIISRMNTPDLVGASAYIPKDFPNLFLPDRLWQTVFLENVKLDSKWLSLLMDCSAFRFLFSILATGTSPSMKNLGQEKLLSIGFPFPPLLEQQSIATYLDTKTTQIDRKIDLLTQKATQYGKLKQSLINETVTRGLDKTVAMKDSGVEWIGEVPEHWEVKRFKEIFNKTHTGWTPDTNKQESFEGDNVWVTIRDMSNNHISDSLNKLSDKAISEAGIPITPKGSLLFSFKLSIGKIAFSECNLYTNEAIISIEDERNINLNYFYYTLPIFLILNAKENIYGAKLLNQSLIFNTSLLTPPKGEQKAISDYLDAKTVHIDRIIETINAQIDKLKELRKTLINDVVTGKIKVA